MASGKAGHRLSAVLAADVVDYSRLTKADEEATVAAMHMLRSTVLDPLFTRHKGAIAKLIEDEVLAVFASPADAVRCAAAIQEGLKRRQEAVAPDRQIILRIGIDVGEVAVEGDGLRGESVAFATRLMQICEPGGVLISAAAQDQLPGEPQAVIGDAGERRVEGASEPVRTYEVRLAKSLESPPRRGGINPIMVAVLALVVLGGAFLLGQSRAPMNPVDHGGPRQDVAEQAPAQADPDTTGTSFWGGLDAVGSDGRLRGWVTDILDPSDKITVYLYASGGDPTGRLRGFSGCLETEDGAKDKVCGDFTFLGKIVAKEPYEVPSDIPERAQGKEHGFSFVVPSQFRDAKTHYFYAFVIPHGHEYEADALLRGESPNDRNLIYLYGSPLAASLKS